MSTKIEPGDWQLREWAPTDETALVKYANNIKIWENVRDVFPYPYTSLDAQEWIDRASQRPITNFAIALPTEAIGGVGFVLQEDIYSRSAEIGYWLGEPFWGKGIATSALGALVRFAFSNFDLVRLYATVFEWNPASARVLEKNGFKLEGRLARSVTKKGATIDSLLYALIRTD